MKWTVFYRIFNLISVKMNFIPFNKLRSTIFNQSFSTAIVCRWIQNVVLYTVSYIVEKTFYKQCRNALRRSNTVQLVCMLRVTKNTDEKQSQIIQSNQIYSVVIMIIALEIVHRSLLLQDFSASIRPSPSFHSWFPSVRCVPFLRRSFAHHALNCTVRCPSNLSPFFSILFLIELNYNKLSSIFCYITHVMRVQTWICKTKQSHQVNENNMSKKR